MTEQQLLVKLTALCARGECCVSDMRKKMARWAIEDDMQDSAIAYLLRERYIDEERYARFFVNDKMKYNKWGRRKIEQALYMKGIESSVYGSVLDEIESEEYDEYLMSLLRSKKRSVKGDSPYEIEMKLIRYAMQRGYAYDQAKRCLEVLAREEEE